MSWSTSELRVRLAPWNRFKSSSIFVLTVPRWYFFCGSIMFFSVLCFYVFSVLCLLCLCAHLFICALWSPAGKGRTSWLSFVVSNCEFVTFPLVFWVRCGTWLYRFLIFAPLLTFIWSFSFCSKSQLEVRRFTTLYTQEKSHLIYKLFFWGGGVIWCFLFRTIWPKL